MDFCGISGRIRGAAYAAFAIGALAGCGTGDRPAAALDAAFATASAEAPRGAATAPLPPNVDRDRASVRAAYAASRQAEGRDDARYRLTLDGSALHGRNQANGFAQAIDRDGFAVERPEDGWRVRFETRGLRCGEAAAPVAASELRAVRADAPHRASIARVAGRAPFEEWVVNGPLGLEHGYTLPVDPCGGRSAELAIDVSVDGLAPAASGDAIALRDADGVAVARYGEVYAHDANGTPLDATLAVEGPRIALRAKIAGAVWPVTLDPLVTTREAKLAEGAAGDKLGHAVAIDGDYAVVGAYQKSIGANSLQGAAYVFVRSGATWQRQAKLTAGDGRANGWFGSAVAISGASVLVGANYMGGAYVFTRSGTTWTQQSKLVPTGSSTLPFFVGTAVALSGDTALVGAEGSSVGAINQSPGAAYVFVRSGTTWTQQAELYAGDAAANDDFGAAVAVRGDTAVIGAYAKSVAGNARQGAAYVFARSGAAWTQQAKLTAADGIASANFGASVGTTATSVIVGAPGTTVGGVSNRGAAYVFAQAGAAWPLQQELVAADGAMGDFFGCGVAIDGDLAAVGARQKSVGAASLAGNVYTFARAGAAWTQSLKSTASDFAAGDLLGDGVALSGTTVLAGASGKTVGGNAAQGGAYAFNAGVEEARLGEDETATNDYFGRSVAIDGSLAVVGVPGRTVGANAGQGVAYVYQRSGTYWTEQAKLVAADGAAGDAFGYACAISGGTAVVGAYLGAVGSAAAQGAAYVFVQSGSTWTQQAKLVAADGAANDQFGRSVAVSGDSVVVGAYAHAGGGAAYAFARSGTSWSQQARLVPSLTGSEAVHYFGRAVALSGDTAIVGDDYYFLYGVGASGAGFVFVRTGSTWTQQAVLRTRADDRGGAAVALSGNLALLGAWAATNGSNVFQGAAYAFARSGATWTQQARLVADDGAANDEFGAAVALSGPTAVIGAHRKQLAATGEGQTYVFVQSGSTWTQQAKIAPTDPAASSLVDADFGGSVAISGGVAVVAATSISQGTIGNAGAAYAFRLGGVAGYACGADADCATSYACSDGVCCATSCAGPCDVCSLAAATSAGAAASRGGAQDGICTLLPQGTLPTQACAGNLVCSGATGFCPASCVVDADCSAGNFCTSAGTCQPSRQAGAPCDYSGDCKNPSAAQCALCASGNCVDGVCCNTSCAGACDRCDLANQKGTCSATPASYAQACGAGYLCNGALTSCPTSCSTDAGCSSGWFCNTSATPATCAALLPNGGACSRAGQCASGHCVDGVCCDSECTGLCQACKGTMKAAGADGACGNAKSATDPHDQCAPEAQSTCGQNGSCNGAGACDTWPVGTSCGNATCVGNESRPQQCTGARACGTVSGTACGAYLCNATTGACPTSCASDTACATGYFCTSGACVSKQATGATCTSPSQCANGNCVDGFCCDTACAGLCEACSATKKGTGSNGTCGPVAGASDPDGECAGEPASSCGQTGMCDGNRACALWPTGTTCASATCVGNESRPRACAGSATCAVSASGTACGAYLCDASTGACPGACLGDAQCASGKFCSAGVCTTKLGAGASCTASTQCGTGYCVDGFCCDTACSGGCEACSAAKKGTGANGACGAVVVGTDPDNECAQQAQSTCGLNGSCDGSRACAYWANGTTCGSPSCVGNESRPSVCTGPGTCGKSATGTACGSFACGAATGLCATSCSSDVDCATGSFCEGATRTCQTKLGTGATCASASACATGNCVDGFCCDTACAGTCVACSAARKGGGSDGACGAIAVNTDPDNECPTEPKTTCGKNGSCDGSGACAYWPVGTLCGSGGGACNGNLLVGEVCRGPNACAVAAGGVACSPQSCMNGACAPCATAADCFAPASSYCSQGACLAKKPTGGLCATKDECTSGNCVDGFCCDTACEGSCEACSAQKKGAGKDGECGAVASGQDPDGDCAEEPTSTCGHSGQCDGNRACAFWASGTACGEPTCVGNESRPRACTAPNTCSVTANGTACGAYACAAASGTCLTTCATAADCVLGNHCDASSHCRPLQASGQACASADACASGNCVDGFCCDTACQGTCEACSTLKKGGGADGYCGPIAAGSDPDDECAAQPQSTCGTDGACDGERACEIWPVGTDCSPVAGTKICAGNKVTRKICLAANSCDVAPGGLDCGAQKCVGGECAACMTTADCASPATAYCGAGGQCLPKLEQGGACSADEQCGGAHCVDGVCCNTACDGACEWCGDVSQPGVCVPVPIEQQPLTPGKTQCAGFGTPCGGSCNGSKRDGCVFPGASLSCEPSRCVGDSLITARVCDGTGACAAGSQQTCGEYACGASGDAGAACKTSCATSIDCRAGSVCDTSRGEGVCNASATICDGPFAVKAADGTVTSCGGYACKAGACQSSCAAAADCDAASGYACSAGRCAKPAADAGEADAGPTPVPADAGSSGGCAVESRAARQPGFAFALALAAIAAKRRRPRRRAT